MTIGIIRTFSVDQGGLFTASDGAVYARCDGQTLARASYTAFSALVSGTSWGSDDTNIKLPVLSGMYFRGTDFGRNYDPDKADRVGLPNSAGSPPSGDSPGSYQYGMFGAHRHVYTNNINFPENPSPSLRDYEVLDSNAPSSISVAGLGSTNPSGIDGTDVKHIQLMPYIRIA